MTQNQPKVAFYDSQVPALQAGDYTIQATLSIQSANTDNSIPASGFQSSRRNFSVLGPRFSLAPGDIQSVFPPEGSLGDHRDVLPHVIFNRGTLPWERSGGYGTADEDIPWLALLVFQDSEAPDPETITVSQLEQGGSAAFPTYTPRGQNPGAPPYWEQEYGQDSDDQLTVIDVPASLLESIVPLKAELPYLVHSRVTLDDGGQPQGDPFSIVIANRLPKSGSTNTVHLVSVEGRYPSSDFDLQGASGESKVRLVSLKSWRFTNISPEMSFEGMLSQVSVDSLRLPTTNMSGEAAERLQMGFTALPHFMRQGNRTVSWYHGPCLPGAPVSPPSVNLPILAADELALFNSQYGMFDVSYAAAWELGRLLSLHDKTFSRALYQWKRAHITELKAAEQSLTHPFLSGSPPNDLPDTVVDWFNAAALLQGVPFPYLVPVEGMLPTESLRFFTLDTFWLECLLDGAFSIGRVSTSEQNFDVVLRQKAAALTSPGGVVSGFFLRSQVVSGYPNMVWTAYDQVVASGQNVPPGDPSELTCARSALLSPNVMICLFLGSLQTLDLYLKAEALHFGVDEDNQGDHYKELRDPSTGLENANKVIQPLPWRDGKSDADTDRVLNVGTLGSEIAETLDITINAASFAEQMIEGGPRLRFTWS